MFRKLVSLLLCLTMMVSYCSVGVVAADLEYGAEEGIVETVEEAAEELEVTEPETAAEEEQPEEPSEEPAEEVVEEPVDEPEEEPTEEPAEESAEEPAKDVFEKTPIDGLFGGVSTMGLLSPVEYNFYSTLLDSVKTIVLPEGATFSDLVDKLNEVVIKGDDVYPDWEYSTASKETSCTSNWWPLGKHDKIANHNVPLVIGSCSHDGFDLPAVGETTNSIAVRVAGDTRSSGILDISFRNTYPNIKVQILPVATYVINSNPQVELLYSEELGDVDTDMNNYSEAIVNAIGTVKHGDAVLTFSITPSTLR